MAPVSSVEVAKLVGIGPATLERWIREGKVRPKVVEIGKKAYRLWTDAAIEEVRRVKLLTYRKGRGRKKKV